MIAWYWLVVAFVIGSAVTTIIHYWFEDANNIVTELFAAIAFPFVWVAMFPIHFWMFFFRPITFEQWNLFQKLRKQDEKSKFHYITKNIVLMHDPNSKYIQDKWILVRIKKDGDASD